MEGEIGALLGLCLDGWWLGWLRGNYLSCTEALYTVNTLMRMCIGCPSPEIYRPGLPFPNFILWCCQCRCKRVNHAEVYITCAQAWWHC